MEEAKQKAENFRNEIRDRQRKAMINAMRKEYLQAYEHQLEQQESPLISRTLQKFYQLPHQSIGTHLPQITTHLLDSNVYLSQYMQQQQTQDQQTRLVQDLFYLCLQHGLVLPRKFRLLHTGDSLTASFVALVSHQILPEELAYWLQFMGDEDRELMYANMWEQELGYQSWVNHPGLRDALLADMHVLQEAAAAIRDIVGRGVHPDRLKDARGRNMGELLVILFTEELEAVMQQVPSQNCQTSNQNRPRIMAQHLQLAIRCLTACMLSSQQSSYGHTLLALVDSLLARRIEGPTQIISPLFCIWVLQAWSTHSLRVLTSRGEAILIGYVRYDQARFSKAGVDMGKLSRFQQSVCAKGVHLGMLEDGSGSQKQQQF